MEGYLDILSVLILLSTFVLVGNKRTMSCIKTFRIQSILISIVTGILGIKGLFEGEINIILVCILIIIVKIIYIPNLLDKTYANTSYKVKKGFYLNIPFHILACCILIVFVYLTIPRANVVNTGVTDIQLVNSVSVILMGFYFMITRRLAIGQIVGLLVIENGIFIAAIFATYGMPFIVDVGILIDVITAVLVMSILVFKINKRFESVDINKLKKLRG